jgi:glycosylphosphatidylinositol transamidase (GPIT) subunit GPI8
VYNAEFLSSNIDFIPLGGKVTNPDGENANSVGSLSPNPGGGLGALNLIPACTGPDCSHNYALLIDGGINYTQNHIRYWNDISFMYQTLNQTYGYPRDHIIVLMSDGQSSGLDRHNATKPDGTYLKDSSPLNLDNSTDNLIDVSALSATKTNVTDTLTSFNLKTPSADNLFIFTTGHGGADAVTR